MSNNTNREGFLAHVEDISRMESDVDKLLEAARLQRIESGKRRISPAMRIAAMAMIAAIVGAVMYFDFTMSDRPGMSMFIGMIGLAGIAAALFAGNGV